MEQAELLLAAEVAAVVTVGLPWRLEKEAAGRAPTKPGEWTVRRVAAPAGELSAAAAPRLEGLPGRSVKRGGATRGGPKAALGWPSPAPNANYLSIVVRQIREIEGLFVVAGSGDRPGRWCK